MRRAKRTRQVIENKAEWPDMWKIDPVKLLKKHKLVEVQNLGPGAEPGLLIHALPPAFPNFPESPKGTFFP